MAGEDRLDRLVRQQGIALEQVRAGVHTGVTLLLLALSLTWARPFQEVPSDDFGAEQEQTPPLSLWSVVGDATDADPQHTWVLVASLVLLASLVGCAYTVLSAGVGSARAGTGAQVLGGLGAVALLVLAVTVADEEGLDLSPARDVWFLVLALGWVQVAAYRLKEAWR